MLIKHVYLDLPHILRILRHNLINPINLRGHYHFSKRYSRNYHHKIDDINYMVYKIKVAPYIRML